MATMDFSQPAAAPASITLADIIPSFYSTESNYLDNSTVKALRRVSREVRDAVNPFLYKIRISPIAFRPLSRCKKSSLALNIKEVTLVSNATSGALGLISEVNLLTFCNNTKKLKNLEYLEIQQTCQAALLALAQCTAWPKLKTLKITINRRDRPTNVWLTKVEIEAFKNTNWPLESLSIIVIQRQPGNVISAATKWMLPCFPRLKKLAIFLGEATDARALVNAGLRHLEELTIMNIGGHGGGGRKEDVPGELSRGNFPKLSKFCMQFSSQICNVSAFGSAPWIRNLKVLSMTSEADGIHRLTAGSILHGLDASEHLEYLQLDLNWKAVVKFGNISLPVLKKLQLRVSCSNEEANVVKSLDKPLQGLFKASIPAIKELNVTICTGFNYEWKELPVLNAEFPILHDVKLQLMSYCGGIQVSPAVKEFVSMFMR